jgi:predicted permease
MSRSTETWALRIYRRLAEAFPHEFKMVYGMDVIALGEDMVQEIAEQHGVPGLFRLIFDIAIRVPIEYLSEMRRDIAYAIRALLKSPGFALVGILSLGLGIGVATTVYSSVSGMIFRDLPGVPDPGSLVTAVAPSSYYYIEQYREQKSLFTGVAGFKNAIPFNVAFEGSSAKPERIFGHLVTPDYFSVIGVSAQRGRMLSPDVDKPGGAPVVVISDRFWRNRLNSAPDVVGSTLRLNGQTATIVGIGPKDFNGVMSFLPAELFVPVTVPAALAPELSDDVLHNPAKKTFLPLMRLAHGVSQESAEVGLDTIRRHLDEQESPTATNSAQAAVTDKTRRVQLVSGGTVLPIPRAVKPVLLGFYTILITLILGIACMNLANMLLARGAARRKELAIRLAVGASRFRLIRQMMSEGILLALFGGSLGLLFAYWSVRMTSQMKLPLSVPVDFNLSLNWTALVFTFALTVVCGIGFSLAPALAATRADVAPALKEGAGVQLRAYRKFGMRNLLVVGQVAGSLMLLLITGFVVIGSSQSASVKTNFDTRTMYLLSIDPVRDGYSPDRARALFEQLPDRLKRIPTVRSVALAADPPFSITDGAATLSSKLSAKDAISLKSVGQDKIGAGYFATLDEPVLRGREFDAHDEGVAEGGGGSKGVPLPVILNQTAAQGLFPKDNPVGQRINEDNQSYEVIGVVRDLRNGLGGGDSAIMYLPLTRHDFASPPPNGMTVMVRSDAGTDALAGIRHEIADVDPNLAVFDVKTLEDYLDISKSYMRIASTVYGSIGVFGLILAAIGLAGVTAYAVARRRKEIGIRMALGAKKSQVLRLVLNEGIALVIVGTIFGFLGATAVAKVLTALTDLFTQAFQLGTNDPRLLIGAPVLLAGLAMIACYLPARRSMKIDPLKALREE